MVGPPQATTTTISISTTRTNPRRAQIWVTSHGFTNPIWISLLLEKDALRLNIFRVQTLTRRFLYSCCSPLFVSLANPPETVLAADSAQGESQVLKQEFVYLKEISNLNCVAFLQKKLLSSAQTSIHMSVKCPVNVDISVHLNPHLFMKNKILNSYIAKQLVRVGPTDCRQSPFLSPPLNTCLPRQTFMSWWSSLFARSGKKRNFLTNVVSKLYDSLCYLILFGPVDTVNRAEEVFDLMT